ncbi:MAG: mercuric transporter MerT family protein [Gemmatimonadota bacterium]|nr:mercuric transporter MerT family protein [Gemmatimonadota bacterium]
MKETHKTAGFSLGGIAAAIGSAVCCAGPVVAVSLGVSGAAFASVEPFRPYFLLLTAAFLAAGFWLLHREERKACEPGRTCADPAARRRMKVMLWVATVVALVFATFPAWLGLVPGIAAEPDRTEIRSVVTPAEGTHPAETASPLRSVALDVNGMTCEGCAASARLAAARISGVQAATFSYEDAGGTVTFDPDVTTVEEIVAELARMTGFVATEKEPGSSADAGHDPVSAVDAGHDPE